VPGHDALFGQRRDAGRASARGGRAGSAPPAPARPRAKAPGRHRRSASGSS
jgi:hypothetical protein